MKRNSLTIACAAVSVSICAAQGTITGSAKGTDGNIITSGVVNASRAPDSTRSRLLKTTASAALSPDGTFQLSSLGVGTYRLCVQARGWINPCEWGSNGWTVVLSPTQPSVDVTVSLKKSALVTVQVSDPGELLSTHELKTQGAHLLLGVTTDSGFFSGGVITSQFSGGRTYEVRVPFDRPIDIAVASAFFQLGDSTGKALSRLGNAIPVMVQSGQASPLIFLRVLGVRNP